VKWLRPADMAVLVNSRSEADAIRAALAQRGVRSVYLSDKDSVFQSPRPANCSTGSPPAPNPTTRACCAPRWRRHAGPELAGTRSLNHDELAWEARVLQFRGYRDCWRRQGVLPMLRRLLNDFQVPAAAARARRSLLTGTAAQVDDQRERSAS
jgi:exodeoxyribonuclease V beta subunit